MSNQYTKLENRLVLLAWLNDLFGYESNKDLLRDTKGVAEGYDSSGNSYLYYHLLSRSGKIKIDNDKLKLYDQNIRDHLDSINSGRTRAITLRYFQHLAALYTEVFLDFYFNNKEQMLVDLNAFVDERNKDKTRGESLDEEFCKSDLDKLAFWMATGSGKTLLFHLNYYQFLHYNSEELDNILLITPNEGLTEQHLMEMAASDIPSRRFNLESSQGLIKGGVQVIEITKLVEEKRGGGVTVPVEAFEGRNLIFVDEGHKGSGGNVWRGYREALASTGFTFEYSATFGQALSAARKDPLTIEYGKAIAFDYSYYYFYHDGFGKDFRILNLQKETREEEKRLLLLGNLLSFYEQLCVFEDQGHELQPYNLEKPLWVFVGSTVNAVYTRNRKKRSDVLTVVRFLQKVLDNEDDWAVKGIARLLTEDCGLFSSENVDIFANRFGFLKRKALTAEALYADILQKIFHSTTGGNLHLCDIRGNQGEIGLKVSGADQYFGLIYIGDTGAFKRLVRDDSPGIVLEEDAISGSLFSEVNMRDSKINILIGARKFMEGWNSWRVSNMGLLNIGRREGSLIIQLFGRGVRLRGKEYSLKRSSVLKGPHPSYLDLLETLDIFAIRADYMGQFQDYLQREGLDTADTVELALPVLANAQFLGRGLVVPRTEQNRDFKKESVSMLRVATHIKVTVDLSVRVKAIESDTQGLRISTSVGRVVQKVPQESLCLIDWDRLYLDLITYKRQKELYNLVITPKVLKEVIKYGNYVIIADDVIVSPKSFSERALLENAVSHVLRKYVDSFYRFKHERWASENMVYTVLDKNDPNLTFNTVTNGSSVAYRVKVKSRDVGLVAAIEKLQDDLEQLIKKKACEIPHLYFDRHIYLPLLLHRDETLVSSPPGLETSEAQFVTDLREYWETEKEKSLKGSEIYLLRNLSLGKGVGFFKNSGFYPDFIMWVVQEDEQRIIFIEPHGMVYAPSYKYDEKAQLHERLPAIAAEISQRSKMKGITLDSYIISRTPYEELRVSYGDGVWDRVRFADKHILFPERTDHYDYLRIMFKAGGLIANQ